MIASHSFLWVGCDLSSKWKHFPRYWPFVGGIHRSPVKLKSSLICAWINGWINNREDDDFRRHRAHYDVTVMQCWFSKSLVVKEAPILIISCPLCAILSAAIPPAITQYYIYSLPESLNSEIHIRSLFTSVNRQYEIPILSNISILLTTSPNVRTHKHLGVLMKAINLP